VTKRTEEEEEEMEEEEEEGEKEEVEGMVRRLALPSSLPLPLVRVRRFGPSKLIWQQWLQRRSRP